MKVSFQTWDKRKLVLIFNDVQSVTSLNPVFNDVGAFHIIQIEINLFKYIFYNSPDESIVLEIQAGIMEIYETEEYASDINSAL